MKVLIVKVSALGDVVHALPVLSHIRDVHPDAEIDWLVEEAFSPILEGHPLIQRVIKLRTKRWRKQAVLTTLKEVGSFIRELRSKRYDLVFDLQGNSKSGACTLLAKGGNKYGFDRANVREWPNLLATRHHVALKAADHHIAQRALAVVRAALPSNKMVEPAGPLSVNEESRNRISEQLKHFSLHGPLVVCVYGTTWKTKLWALESWKELVKRLCEEQGIRPVLTWGNDEEKKAVDEISKATGRSAAVVWPRGSLQDLVALLDRADLVVGCDTGPVHIAAAVGTPTVSLYRVTDAQRNGPVGESHQRLQTPLDCSPCLRKECAVDVTCSCSIAVDDVYAAVVSQLQK